MTLTGEGFHISSMKMAIFDYPPEKGKSDF
jgi:hypothetical protein